ncbi:MAG: hypothetical protein M3070_18050 [Actinomycetota bacterium]|nr:hypothetical protein [Actinomycetota bacterium]
MTGAVLTVCLAATEVASGNERITSCGLSPNEVFGHAAVFGISALEGCNLTSNAYLELKSNGNTLAAGQRASWQATAPAGLAIENATVNGVMSGGVNDGRQYGGGFYWQGGGAQAFDTFGSELIFGSANSTPGFPSPYFGFQVVCGANPCTNGSSFTLVGAIDLDVAETTPPTLLAGKLWAQHGWVRGDWPLLVNGDSPSGICSLSAAIDGQLVASQSFPADTSAWHQCDAASAGGLNATVHTTQFINGNHQLTASGVDAAGLNTGSSSVTAIHVDNQPPSVALAGPTDAPSTAGTQYVAATATAGPSGISRIVCTVDGGPPQTVFGASADVPVSGIGQHSVSCSALNNATDPAGNGAESSTATSSLKIGQPTVMGIGFDKLVGLRCRRARVPVKVLGRWITVHRHGKPVRVRTRTRNQVERVVRCHPRTVRRRTAVFVRVRRRGHIVRVRRIRIVRVVVSPRTVVRSSRHVRLGHGTTVRGYLGTATGVAIAGHLVRLLTAPANGANDFTEAARATTRPDGTWTARLPPGPSRLVEAVYDGDPSSESASSGSVHLIVPANVQLLRVSPRHVPWGATVRLTGRLAGGYLPAGGALVRLRIGLGRSFTTYGVHEHVTGSGRFKTTYTFGAGQPSVYRSFWFQVASLPMGDYPYAPADSRRIYVVVGGHPPRARQPGRGR